MVSVYKSEESIKSNYNKLNVHIEGIPALLKNVNLKHHTNTSKEIEWMTELIVLNMLIKYTAAVISILNNVHKNIMCSTSSYNV